MKEYPLFTQLSANECPTARYVGGTSKWLCECKKPSECDGVKTTKGVKKFAAFEFTREEYMAGHCSHDQFYGQFLTQCHTDRVAQIIGRNRIINSKHAVFSDIPLKEWDAVPFFSSQAEKMRRLGETPTLSTVVYLAKRAAKQIRMENPTVRQWAITVTYRPLYAHSGSASFETLIQGTIDGILDYYKSDPINVGKSGDTMAKVISVDFTPVENEVSA